MVFSVAVAASASRSVVLATGALRRVGVALPRLILSDAGVRSSFGAVIGAQTHGLQSNKSKTRFDRGTLRASKGDRRSPAVWNGGVWDALGNWFFVTGGKPVFQRLQTPPSRFRARVGRDVRGNARCLPGLAGHEAVRDCREEAQAFRTSRWSSG